MLTPRLILNTVNAAEAGKDRSRSWVVQTGLIQDYDCTIPSNSLMGILSMQGMPRYNSALNSSRPDLLAKQHLVRAINSRQALLRIVYQSPRLVGAVPVERFAVEDVTTLSSGTTQLMPVTLKPLRLTYRAAGGAGPPDFEDTMTLSYPLPMRSLVLYGVFSSRPAVPLRTKIRTVNQSAWEGLPAGFWLYSGIRVRYSDLDEMYSVTCTITTKTCEDWSSYAVLRQPNGRYVKVADSVTTELKNKPYEFGIVNSDRGILKAGLFETYNFSTLFGNI